jgi:hypothetical protein
MADHLLFLLLERQKQCQVLGVCRYFPEGDPPCMSLTEQKQPVFLAMNPNSGFIRQLGTRDAVVPYEVSS